MFVFPYFMRLIFTQGTILVQKMRGLHEDIILPGYLEINVESQTGFNENTKVDGDNTPVGHPNYVLPGAILLTLKLHKCFNNCYNIIGYMFIIT